MRSDRVLSSIFDSTKAFADSYVIPVDTNNENLSQFTETKSKTILNYFLKLKDFFTEPTLGRDEVEMTDE